MSKLYVDFQTTTLLFSTQGVRVFVLLYCPDVAVIELVPEPVFFDGGILPNPSFLVLHTLTVDSQKRKMFHFQCND